MENEWMKCKLDILTSEDGLFSLKHWVVNWVPKLVQLDSAESTLTNCKENPLSHRQSRGFSKLKWAVSQVTCEHSYGTVLLTDVLKILTGPLEMECTYGTNCNQTLAGHWSLGWSLILQSWFKSEQLTQWNKVTWHLSNPRKANKNVFGI